MILPEKWPVSAKYIIILYHDFHKLFILVQFDEDQAVIAQTLSQIYSTKGHVTNCDVLWILGAGCYTPRIDTATRGCSLQGAHHESYGLVNDHFHRRVTFELWNSAFYLLLHYKTFCRKISSTSLCLRVLYLMCLCHVIFVLCAKMVLVDTNQILKSDIM